MEQTIIAYYEAILRQAPTQSQIDQWEVFLAEADDLEDALADFAQALCLQADEVRSVLRLYQAVFDRMSDSGGLTFWTNRFREIQEANPDLSYRDALIETISQWLESDEYIARFGGDLSDEDFLSLVYLNILGRPADQDGYNFWLAVLKSGAMTREQLIVEFTESDEFKAAVDDEANGLLKAAAAIDSDTVVDDLPYELPGGDPYTGELGNEAPIDILIGTDIDENAENNVAVNEGQLTVVDPDGGETFTWELIDPTGTFGLDDPNAQQPKIIVINNSALDHETADVMTVTIRVTDSDNNTYEEDVDIDINDINEAPENLDLSNLTIDEQDGSASNPGVGGLVVGVLTSTDVDDGDTATYTLLSQSVAGAFEIVGNELRVLDPSVIDSEASVASIDVEVQVEDSGGLTQVKTFTINVDAINDEDPTNVDPDVLNISATLPKDFLLTNLFADDPDTTPGTHTFAIKTDPTGGAFKIDASGTQLLLEDPGLLGSDVLTNPVVNLVVTVTDDAGNSYDDTIVINVDQTGIILPFTGATVEVLEGTAGNDAFTANAGLGANGIIPLPPGFGRTANAGDIANGGEGYDWFLLTKQDDNGGDGLTFISGVTLNDIEAAGISNRDISPFPSAPPVIETAFLCIPCVEIPDLAPFFDDPLIYEASTSPDLDFVSFYQSLSSVGIWDVQAPFWVLDPLDANDLGPVVNIDDVTADFVHFDSDPQAKLLGDPIDMLTFTIDEVRINELLITENASGNEPGPMRGEQVGTIRIEADGIPSVIGSLNNGAGPFDPTGSTTHTVEVHVTDLTSSRPTALNTPALNTAAVDLFMGHADGIADGLQGLEFFNIGGGGDFFGVFGTSADFDSDLDGNALTINDTEIDPLTGLPIDPSVSGNSIFFFEEGGFGGGGVTVNGYGVDDFDTIGLFAEDLTGLGDVNDVERLKLLEDVGAWGDSPLNLAAFDGTLDEVLLADGVDGDLAIINIPNRIGSEHDLFTDTDNNSTVLCNSVGEPGVWINIQQKCQPGGALPADFDLQLDGAVDGGTRVDLNFAIAADSEVATLSLTDIDVLRINVEDPSLTINDIDDNDGSLEAIILTDDGTGPASTITILEPDQEAGSTPNLRLVNGSSGTFNQRLFNMTSPAMMFLPVFANWTPDTFIGNPFNDGSFNTFTQGSGGPTNEVVVHADGAFFNMGSGSDWVSGNQNANGIALGQPGGTGLGKDSFEMNDGNDLAFGYDGEDAMEGGAGNDELHGGDHNDTIYGDERDSDLTTGNDLLFGDAGNDRMFGGNGNDIMFGGTGRDYMEGGTGDDTLCGDQDSDCLHGGTGNDLLIGGHDNTGQLIDGINWQGDVLFAGTGIDFLIGDSTCEPQCFTVQLTAEDNILGEGDVYTVDVDGDGFNDLMYTVSNADANNVNFGIDDIVAALESQWVDQPGGLIVDIDAGDPANQFDDVLIIKNWDATNAPILPTADATDGAFCDVIGTPADLSVVVGGKIGYGDEFEFTVDWSGGSKTYSYTVLWRDFPDLANPPTANDVRAKLLAEVALDPPGDGIVIGAGAGAGQIDIDSNPSNTEKVGEVTVTATATEDALPPNFGDEEDDMIGTPTTVCYEINLGTGPAGDIYRVDLNGDGIYDAQYEVQVGDSLADVYQGLINAVNALNNPNIVAYSSSQMVNDGLINTVDVNTLGGPGTSFGTALSLNGLFETGLHPWIQSVGPTASVVQPSNTAGNTDWYSFTLTGDETVRIDIDIARFEFDPEITVYDVDGTTVLFNNDDAPTDPGDNGSIFSSFLTFAAPGAGTYFVEVGNSNLGGTIPDPFTASGNDYMLHVSIEDPTPAVAATDFKLAVLDGTNPVITVDDVNFIGGIDEETITVDDSQKIDIGDTYTVEIDATGNGVVGDAGDIIETYTTVSGDTAASIALALSNQINANWAVELGNIGLAGATVNVVGNVITVTGSSPAVDDIYVEASNDEAGTFACDVWEIDTDNWTVGETIHVEVDTDVGDSDAFPGDNTPPVAVDIPWNGSLTQSLTDLGQAIENVLENQLGMTDVSFSINAGLGIVTIEALNGQFVLGNEDHIANAGSNGILTNVPFVTELQDLGGPGNTNNITATDTAPLPASNDDQDIFKTDETIGEGPSDDDTQSFSGSGTDGTDGEDKANGATVIYDNGSAFSFQGNDVFVAQAVNMDANSANWLAFQASGFDNDDIPYDFRGLLAGETMGTPGVEGADGGVKNVTYVGDWKNGDDLLAFQNEDGSLGPAGNALNYAEFENISATRDDADATAAGIFEGAPSLRYVAIARNDGATDADNYLRVYFNEEGTDKAPEAVFELVGYDSKTEITFTDITDSTQCPLIYEGSGVSNIDDYFC